MLDRQPVRASEIARTDAFLWLPAELQSLLTLNRAQEYNALIADGLLAVKGPTALSKPLRELAPGFTSKEAAQHAIHAFAWALEASSMERIASVGLKLKRAVTSPGCCVICQTNNDQGAMPLLKPFESGHMHAPFCATCRCSTAAVRG